MLPAEVGHDSDLAVFRKIRKLGYLPQSRGDNLRKIWVVIADCLDDKRANFSNLSKRALWLFHIHATFCREVRNGFEWPPESWSIQDYNIPSAFAGGITDGPHR